MDGLEDTQDLSFGGAMQARAPENSDLSQVSGRWAAIHTANAISEAREAVQESSDLLAGRSRGGIGMQRGQKSGSRRGAHNV